MEESEKENLYLTFKGAIASIIEDKLKNPKNEKLIKSFKTKYNLGLQIEKDYYFWLNITAENGKYSLERGKLDEYDLEVLVVPEDLLYWLNRQNSTIHMMLKKNKFGYKKFRFEKGSDGKRNLGILLKLPKVLVLDKVKTNK
ncbi:MAG: hypothetical protein EU532_14175 [Promethearchaeota archaeon]|nr:MAG: hypothetical protein EU532_14175 [Candidatus Lokiarchaeota archaeon]